MQRCVARTAAIIMVTATVSIGAAAQTTMPLWPGGAPGEKNVPAGAKFIVELRAASNGDGFEGEGEAQAAMVVNHRDGGAV